jgi:hypothetical protein
MQLLFRTALAVSAMAITAPVGAWAQAAAGFDGTYGGVSLTASGSGHSCAASSPVPGPLTISGGSAKTAQGQAVFQGTVNAQGALNLHSALGTVMTGKIDQSGNATAGLTTGHDCTYSFAWRKR